MSVEIEIGSELRQARESIGLSLDELQEKTRIQKAFLLAIEGGEFHKLPSPFTVRTHIRTYAKCLAIDPTHMLRRLRKYDMEGRTGVHKSIEEVDLYLPSMKRDPFFQQTGLQQTDWSQPVGQPMQQTGHGNEGRMRTRATTALTATREQIQAGRRERDQVRRDFGYQQTTGVNQTMTDLPPQERRGNTRTAYPTPPTFSPQPTYPPQPAPLPQSAPYPVREPARENPYSSSYDSRPYDLRSQSRTYPEPMDQMSGRTPLEPLGSRKNAGQTSSYSPFDDEEDFGYRSSFDEEEETYAATSDYPSRRSVRSVGAKKKSGKGKVIAIVAVLIGIVWAGYFVATTFNQPTKSANPSDVQAVPRQKPITPPPTTTPPPTPAAPALTLTSNQGNEVVYQLTGTDKLDIQVVNTTGRTRIVVSKDALSSTLSDNLDDKWLPTGYKSYKYTYKFTDQTDVYIILNNPRVVKMTINGQSVQVATIIHIQKTD